MIIEEIIGICMEKRVSILFGHPQGKTSECIDPFFLNWTLEFHVHIDALVISLGVILRQPSEGKMD
jgi:hypothetical protein